jgi:ubiquinone/menaquinone biosynthesis C-methylase UbiE
MQAATAVGDHPTPAIVFETLNAYQRTAALRAAIELGLFRAVGDGPATAPVLAQKCGASERGMRILCDFLVIIGILAKEGDAYSHTPSSEAFLDPRSPSCMASIVGFLSQPDLVTSAHGLADIVRQGRTNLPGEGTVEPNNPIWVEFARSMSPMMAPMTGPLGRIVLDGHSGPMLVLDIAAGHGLFGIEVAKQNPEAHVVALDWAHVLEVALENAENAGVTGRYKLLAGSAFDVDYGGPYDVVLLTNFLHHFDVPTCVELLKKVRSSMKPGGRAAALEFVPNEDRVTPPMAASFSLTMLLTTASGDAYTFSELESMFLEAGFTGITAHPVARAPHTVVMGLA